MRTSYLLRGMLIGAGFALYFCGLALYFGAM